MNLINGVLTGLVALTGGLGLTRFDEGQQPDQDTINQEESIYMNHMGNSESMHMEMDGSVINFGQMKSHIRESHPELNNRELREHYNEMHGTGGSSRSNNFEGMRSMH